MMQKRAAPEGRHTCSNCSKRRKCSYNPWTREYTCTKCSPLKRKMASL